MYFARVDRMLRKNVWMIAAWLVSMLTVLPARAQEKAWLTLEQAMERARAYAPTVVESEGAVRVAQTAEVGARLPSIGNPYLEVTTGRQRLAQLEVEGKLYLPWEVNGQRSARISEAGNLVRWRKLTDRDARARVTGEAVSAWGAVVVAAARVEQAIKAEQEARKEAQWVASRHEMNAATLVERNFAQSETVRWAQSRAEAQLQLHYAQARLAQLTAVPAIGQPASSETATLPQMKVSSEQNLVRRALEGSALLKAYEAEASFWRASAERATRDRNPPVSLVISGGRGDLGEPRVSGGLAWSIPALRRNQGEIARTEAERVRAESLRTSTQGALEARVRGDWQVYQTAAQALQYVDTSGLPATEQLVEAANTAWRAGKGELVQVLIARRDLAAARVRRLDLIETAWRAYGDIVGILGELP